MPPNMRRRMNFTQERTELGRASRWWRRFFTFCLKKGEAGGKKLHIPKEVRAFVDRWEREVLAPAFRRVREEEFREAEAAGLAEELMSGKKKRKRKGAA